MVTVNNGAMEGQSSRPWWERRSTVAMAVLLAFVPLLYPAVPPLVDLLGHMGRYRVELDLDHSATLGRYYGFHWAPIGNLGVDLLVYPLGKLFGLEPAVKLIVSLIAPLTVAGFLWVAREVHGRIPPTAYFALPFVFGHPFLFGFVNFTLALALAFLAFGLWLRLARKGRFRLRAMIFVPISFILYFCHTYGWGMLGLLCFSAEAVRQHDQGASWWKAGLRAVLHAAVMAGPLALILLWRSGIGHGMTGGWFDFGLKIEWLMSALRDRWRGFDLSMVAVAALVFAFALLSRWLTFSRNLAFSALVLLIAFILIPWTVFGSAFADMRLAPYVMAVILLAIRFRRDVNLVMAAWLAAIGFAFWGVKVAATTASLAIAANDQQARMEALPMVPAGARLVTLVGQSCDGRWALFRNSHLGAMALVRRGAFSNDQWTVEALSLLAVHYDAAKAFHGDPSEMVQADDCTQMKIHKISPTLRAIPRQAFDYVWLIDPPPHDPALLADYDRIWSGPGSVLYQIKRSAASGAPNPGSTASREPSVHDGSPTRPN